MKQQKKEKTTTLSRAWLIPLVIAVAVVPLIVVAHYFRTDLAKEPWFSTGADVYDSYLFYKSVAIQILGGTILVLLAFMIPKSDRSFLKEKRSIPPFVAMGVFAVMTIISSILSKHKSDAFLGGFEQFEGCLVLLSYVACFFMAFGFVKTIELARFILDALLIGSFIIGVLGTFQAFGFNWINTGLGKAIQLLELNNRSDLAGQDFQITSSMDASYVTLYNPNYVGSYVALTLPYSAFLIIKGKGVWRRVLAAATSVMLLITLNSAGSAAGYVGLAAGLLVCVILVLPFFKKAIRWGVIGAGVVVVGVAVFMVITRPEIASLFGRDNVNAAIENMKTDDNSVIITTTDGKKLRVSLDKEKMQAEVWSNEYKLSDMLTVTDEKDNTPVNLYFDSDVWATIAQDGYPSLVFCFQRWTIAAEESADGNAHTFDVFHIADRNIDGEPIYDWSFLDAGENGELMYYDSLYGKVDTFHKVKKAGFEGHLTLASGRGFIWSRTFPMLTECLITGYGPDNFIYHFPNNDYVGKVYASANHVIMSRPHNMFLQIWTQEGLLALLGFLALYSIFIARVIRLCYRRKKPQTDLKEDSGNEADDTAMPEKAPSARWQMDYRSVAIVTAIGTTAYMVTGLANDSIVCVAPIYWVMLGVGYAAESMWRKEIR